MLRLSDKPFTGLLTVSPRQRRKMGVIEPVRKKVVAFISSHIPNKRFSLKYKIFSNKNIVNFRFNLYFWAGDSIARSHFFF